MGCESLVCTKMALRECDEDTIVHFCHPRNPILTMTMTTITTLFNCFPCLINAVDQHSAVQSRTKSIDWYGARFRATMLQY